MTPVSVEAASRVLAALRSSPAGLFTDIDGTISPIATTPEEAGVLPEARRALELLAERLSIVACITGRAAEYARQMVDLPGVLYIGNHGLEELSGGQVRVLPEAEQYLPRIQQVLRQLEPEIDIPGVIVEDKGVTASVHYRATSEPISARSRLMELLGPLAKETGMVLYDGRMVIEIRPPVPLGKGAAIRRIVERAGLAGCVYMGDDHTDVDGFRALRGLRQEGVQTVSVGVLSPEAPAAVRTEADVCVEGVAGVVALLEYLVREL